MVEGLPEKQMRNVQNFPKTPAMLDGGVSCARRFGNRPLSPHLLSPGIQGRVHAIP